MSLLDGISVYESAQTSPALHAYHGDEKLSTPCTSQGIRSQLFGVVVTHRGIPERRTCLNYRLPVFSRNLAIKVRKNARQLDHDPKRICFIFC